MASINGESRLGGSPLPPTTLGRYLPDMRGAAIFATALVLTAIAACGEPPPEAVTKPSIEADGPVIEGSGYSFRVPASWGPGPTDFAGLKVDSSAVNLRDNDSFQDNINVIFSPAGPMPPDEIESRGIAELELLDPELVEVRSRVEVAGEMVPHVTALLDSADGPKLRIDQFYITDRDDTHIVTFSFNANATAPERVALWSPVLATWEWRD